MDLTRPYQVGLQGGQGFHLLFSAGRSINGPTDFQCYFAIQFTFDKLSVVFVILLATLFLGEKLTWQQWLGGGLISVGAIVIAWKPA